MDNHILCNIPRGRSCSSTSSKQKNRGNTNNSSSSRMLEISKVDFAGFGLFEQFQHCYRQYYVNTDHALLQTVLYHQHHRLYNLATEL